MRSGGPCFVTLSETRQDTNILNEFGFELIWGNSGWGLGRCEYILYFQDNSYISPMSEFNRFRISSGFCGRIMWAILCGDLTACDKNCGLCMAFMNVGSFTAEVLMYMYSRIQPGAKKYAPRLFRICMNLSGIISIMISFMFHITKPSVESVLSSQTTQTALRWHRRSRNTVP